MSARIIMKLKVVARVPATDRVATLVLCHPTKPQLPTWTGGAHVDVRLPDGKIRQYSLCGDPSRRDHYRIAVQKESEGRGGSLWIHDRIGEGDIVHVSAPRTNFSLDENARRHVFVAGGIGVTPLIAMAQEACQANEPFDFHYCARKRGEAPLLPELEKLCGDRLHTHFSDEQRLDVDALVGSTDRDPDVHIYSCGPARLTDAIATAAQRAGWPAERVHFEVFQAALDENFKPEPFEITIASTGQVLTVPADKTALEILRENGFSMPSSCELGVCGACICSYSEGDVIHRDSVLSLADRQSRMTPCISRARHGVTLNI